MATVLSVEEVQKAADVPGAVDALDAAYKLEAEGKAHIASRINLMLGNGWLRLMAAALPELGVMGYKEFHLIDGQVRYLINLFDIETGEPLVLMDADYLTVLRTAASAALAARYLAPEARTLGVVGSGAEARMQVRAVAQTLPIERMAVYSPRRERRQQFAHDMGTELGVPIDPVDEGEGAVREADMVVVATNTAGRGPAFQGRWIPKGIHVSSIGSTLPVQRELDEDSWERVDAVVVDTLQVLDESGDAIAAREAGTLDTEKVSTLAELCRSPSAIADGAGRTTLYKSVGSPLQDVAVAAYVYEQAGQMGLGEPLRDFQSVKQLS